MNPVGVVVLEDDPMVQDWVQLALDGPEFRFAGAASNADDALELVRRRRPSVLLIDYRLGTQKGTELLRAMRLEGVTTPAVIMTANRQPGLNEEAREAGAQGSVLKTGRAAELLAALRTVAGGGSTFDARHPRRDAGRGALSPRERQALLLVARGSTNREIAEELAVGGETVKTLLARTFAKLGVRRRAEAVAAAHARGLL